MSFDTEELLFHMMDKALAIDVFDVLFFSFSSDSKIVSSSLTMDL